MRTLSKWIKDVLDNDTDNLFDDTFTYPAPLDVKALRERVGRVMVRYFGTLLMDGTMEALDVEDIPAAVLDDLWMHQHELDMISHIIYADTVDPETAARTEVTEYGADAMQHGAQSTTTNIGARSKTDSIGATSGTSTSKATGYDTVTGKETTEQTINTNAAQNGTTQAAATDTVASLAYTDTRLARTDTKNIYTNIDMDAMPDYEAKVLALIDKPVYLKLCRILAGALTIPIYGG